MQQCKPALWTLAVLAALGALAGVALLFGGAYNIAATAQHTQPVYSLLARVMHSSVKMRARAVVVPDRLDDPARVLRGAACFRNHCEQCHGGPGVAADPIGMSMQPVPDSLIAAGRHWQARELYWITRHGIKMSGMPAWQNHLSEAELWAVVAFVQKLPGLSAGAYAELIARAPPGPCMADGPRETLVASPAPNDRAERGHLALRLYGCHACHSIPGITGPQPQVGPPLAGFASGRLIAGRLANTHANLVAWIRHPQRIDPKSAMPDLGVTEEHADEIAAYLATLR